MSYRTGLITGIVSTALVAGSVAVGWWAVVAKPKEAAKAGAPGVPATVPKPFKEDQAATVVLTAEADAKLGVRLAEVARKPMPRKRVFGGEVIVPPGRSLIVSAPLAGTLRAGAALVPGQVVRAGKPVLHLAPILDPVGRANLAASRGDAEGQVKTADEQLKLAQITFNRAKDILIGGGGRQRDVDDASAALEVARQTHAAAVARRDLLGKVLGELDSGTATPIPVEAPADGGVLRNVSAMPGQTVPAGAPLFEVMSLDAVWVRVPVYVGDRDEIDCDHAASIGALAAPSGHVGRPAWLVAAPPTANPLAGTVDMFFWTMNPGPTDERLRATAAVAGVPALAPFVGPTFSPGQRVAVTLTLKDPSDVLTVPWSAVVYDYFGGAWVYVKAGDHTYSRERVLVRYVSGHTAVLDAGPAPGKSVVTAGAAELFGTETGFSK
ncbi:efflux RND transporter periplasmic adaptor subunit [Frigoriglobus tundricola]|nr:HlyD family efflux transporter periplasmic adaptor subunit [Frigoriglobus tundricola]